MTRPQDPPQPPQGLVARHKDLRLGVALAIVLIVFAASFGLAPAVGAASPPTVDSFSPAGGVAGEWVTVYGTGLSGVGSVKFDGFPTYFTSMHPTYLLAEVPALASRLVHVSVTTSAGTGTSASTFAVAPYLTSFSPAGGPIGSVVTIRGSGSAQATAVSISGVPMPATFWSRSVLTARVPPGAATGFLSVSAEGGESTAGTKFKVTPVAPPTISEVKPIRGASAGRDTVSIVGSGFATATKVVFGSGVPAQSFMVVDDSHITAVSPPHAAGLVNIFVTNAGGTNPGGPNDPHASSWFDYLNAPTITKVTPISGPTKGGNFVTITGTGLRYVNQVRFGSTPTLSFNTGGADSSMVVGVPAHAAGIVNIYLTSPGGTNDSRPASWYRYT